jgi:acyl-CoA hydrolase
MSKESILEALATFRQMLPQRARVYVGGGSGEPLAVAEALTHDPTLANDVTFFGIWIPGVNKTDWASLHPSAKAESIFISPALRPSFEAGRTRFLPLSYTQSVDWLAATQADGAIIMTSPPCRDGYVSPGVSADFSTLISGRPSIPLMGVINGAMKAPINGPKIRLDRFEVVATTNNALIQVENAILPGAFDAIGRHIAALCEPGDTLQFGLGSVQQAVLTALRSHQELRIHSGMISNPIIDLLNANVIAAEHGAVTTGVAVGTNALYDKAVEDDRFRFAPATFTHAIDTLARIKRFKAINSCIEVDLLGQANAEFIGGRQISGTGGLVDFLRGAALSEGGRAIVALPSTAKQNTISRIVPRLSGYATSVARVDVDTVVTEHGVATLKHKPIDERAHALIAIADPAFRDQLSAAWHELRKGL